MIQTLKGRKISWIQRETSSYLKVVNESLNFKRIFLRYDSEVQGLVQVGVEKRLLFKREDFFPGTENTGDGVSYKGRRKRSLSKMEGRKLGQRIRTNDFWSTREVPQRVHRIIRSFFDPGKTFSSSTDWIFTSSLSKSDGERKTNLFHGLGSKNNVN